ncbi:MAG: hypothetical protein AAGJ82_06245 [Bacteroidota bacterium]
MSRTTMSLVVISLYFFTSCTSTNTGMLVETAKEENLCSLEKIVLIDPEVVLVDNRKQEKVFFATDRIERVLREESQASADRLNIDLVTYDKETLANTEVNFYNELQHLRYQILRSNLTQEVKSARQEESTTFWGSLQQPHTREFAKDPSISPAFGYLAEQYGTPYFAVQGVYSEYIPIQWKRRITTLVFFPPFGIAQFLTPNTNTFYYFIIADVRSGKVIHREIRLANNRASRQNLKLMIYDSFNVALKNH